MTLSWKSVAISASGSVYFSMARSAPRYECDACTPERASHSAMSPPTCSAGASSVTETSGSSSEIIASGSAAARPVSVPKSRGIASGERIASCVPSPIVARSGSAPSR